ncbi:MAG: SH3 domain-containing protein [Candidatus Marinimicrobia bacterium]|nr:SH3 domain-containing protein [Candidatus Neomarinimicrobiota bacterium]MCF7828119.1 SH3 domain-containing protein [Candidatus Neomarinimicrobiota bacterium]MCF7879706.1 SH3 domain-containing protein [Candidatus Neomarinimicrobiota bacterium]
MTNYNRIATSLLIFLVALMSTIAAQESQTSQKLLTAGMAWVEASNLNVRAEPSLNANAIGSFSEGTVVDVLRTQGNWARVRSRGTEGWVAQDYLNMGQTAWVNVSILNLRESPDSNADVVFKLVYNQRVIVLNRQEGWAFVVTDEYDGWVAEQYLRTEYAAWISAAVLNMRTNSSLDAEVVAQLEQGQKVDVLDENSEWARVAAGNDTGWVYKTYLSTEPVADASVELERRREYLETNPDLPNVIKSAIQSGSFRIGMNKEQVLASLGKPDRVEKGRDVDSSEKWIYKNNGTITTLNFSSDYLSSWSRDIPTEN